ncbi:MAG: Rpn family recombination-promoting nuclease/putative transposase [bacterium]|nr:Rpn family recombination-promoting nuclease/putative transposase [bacterium]MCM1373962.1 Rpn family recombination-promoting nuclease/putative transposase [Muribaculum sp.]
MNDGARTPLEELNLTDRFLFAETMDEPEAYEAMVGILLGDEIRLAGYPQTEKELRVSPGLRAVRLDVVSMDSGGRIYFTEMQKTDTGNLLKRSRYYQAQLDVSLLEPGCSDFNRLNDSCLVLVAPFDLFGYGLYRYTFRGQCQEVPELVLPDGADRVFINTYGTNREAFSQEFLDLMEYINDTRDEVGARSESARLQAICNRVERVRRSEKCGVKYMQRWEEIEYARQDAYAEGRSEGRSAGWSEGRSAGRSEGRMSEVIRAVCKKLVKGKDMAQIADELEKEPEDIAQICRVAERYAPAYDADAICRELLGDAV